MKQMLQTALGFQYLLLPLEKEHKFTYTCDTELGFQWQEGHADGYIYQRPFLDAME